MYVGTNKEHFREFGIYYYAFTWNVIVVDVLTDLYSKCISIGIIYLSKILV